jgi:hypothetical protein
MSECSKCFAAAAFQALNDGCFKGYINTRVNIELTPGMRVGGGYFLP